MVIWAILAKNSIWSFWPAIPSQGGHAEKSHTWGFAWINETELHLYLGKIKPTGSQAEFSIQIFHWWGCAAVRRNTRFFLAQNAYFKDATSSFQLLSFVLTNATSHPTRRRRVRRLNMKYSTRGAARRVELAGAHREIPRLKTQCARGHARETYTSRTPRLRLSDFRPCQPMRRVAPLDADASAGST